VHGDKTAASDEDAARNTSESFRVGGWMDEYRRFVDAKCRGEHLDLDDKSCNSSIHPSCKLQSLIILPSSKPPWMAL
jgi:hypothetical protein